MNFEYDPAKSAANKDKHGIDFDAAQELWLDDTLLTIAARQMDEPRIVSTGRICEVFWTAVWLMRGEKIRIISVRRARKEEVTRYESQ
ncbi:MAG: BrnT family toxin [Cypionkella sp.]|nr:BrnT family toxin [Cypionkella sp.]